MSDLDDNDLYDLIDDDFDYQKEIEAIEAQERELELQRQKKKEELERLKLEREKTRKNRKADKSAQTKAKAEKEKQHEASVKKQERKELKKEAEWLGDPFDENETAEEAEIKVVKPKKKKSKKGLAVLVVLILIVIGAGGFFAYTKQAEARTLSDFQEKVASFKSEKLDGTDLGVYETYFSDFMTKCDEAIEAGDLDAINELNSEWDQIESKYTDVANGKTSIEAFVKSTDEALKPYVVTGAYEDTYNTLMDDIKTAQEECDYEQISDLQKRVDSLVTNLKSANMKKVQTIKNQIANLDLDSNYVTTKKQAKFDSYSEEAEAAISEGDYATAISVLRTWRKSAKALAADIAEKKAQAVAESESESRAAEQARLESESKAQSEAESRALAAQTAQTTQTTAKATTETAKKSSSGSGSTKVSGDYVFADSNSRYLTDSDLKGLSSYQLMIARNEIYARRGYIFKSEELKEYFESKSWYKGTTSDMTAVASKMNDYEIKNITKIQSYE